MLNVSKIIHAFVFGILVEGLESKKSVLNGSLQCFKYFEYSLEIHLALVMCLLFLIDLSNVIVAVEKAYGF